MKPPIQKILFGSPGTGKSYAIRSIANEKLDIEFDENTGILQNTVKTVFHPEYTYADFMGKLLPLTKGNDVIYRYYPGHFLRVLGMAFRSLLKNEDKHCLLVIDELNRGNAAAIFGSVFQLLDRNDDNWSTYEIDISEMELIGLLESMGYGASYDGTIKVKVKNSDIEFGDFCEGSITNEKIASLLKKCKIKIPNNLSIIATINTSDESIYYIDSAFKRRWDWEYVDSPSKNSTNIPEFFKNSFICDENDPECGSLQDVEWWKCVIGVNEFIKSHHQSIRRIEDKQIGWWFINPQSGMVTLQKIQDKLMFYLWDSVFARDKRPLEKVLTERLGTPVKLITYADFIQHTEELLLFFSRNHNSILTNKEEGQDEIDSDNPDDF